MEISKLRELKKEELLQRLVQKRDELATSKYEKLLGRESDTSKFIKLKTEIAQMKTILKEDKFTK